MFSEPAKAGTLNVEGLRLPEALHFWKSQVAGSALDVLHVAIQLELELVERNVLVLLDIRQADGS